MDTGSRGEDRAVFYLQKRGYRILERNYRNRLGEIDIIALEKGTIVFIEVKTRTSDSFGFPFEAVTKRKREKMKNVALLYLKKFRHEVPARFDVVSIFLEEATETVEIIRDAFS